jgi:ZIP family zinc transporter
MPATVDTAASADADLSAPPAEMRKAGIGALLLLLAPLLLLVGVIALFVSTSGAGLNVTPAAPIETVQFGRTVLRPGQIELHLRNTSPEAITLAQININDAIWPYTASPGRAIQRLGTAVVTLDYPWIDGEAYEIALLSSNSIPFATSIPVAVATARASAGTLWSFTLIGLYVGILPVLLGMLWLPALRRVGPATLSFVTAATVGLLLYLGLDAVAEALEMAAGLSATYQGVGIVGIGIAGTWVLLDALSRRQRSVGQSETGQRRSLAMVIAVGIGLHNLGEGLAIGAAYAVGAAALGTFLVIGFIIQNITEGLGIVVPIARDKPSLRSLGVLGFIGGAPAIIGAWVGGLMHSQAFSVLFLAIGAGAVFQVAHEIGREMVWKETSGRQRPLAAFGGVLAGMLVLYLTGVVVK